MIKDFVWFELEDGSVVTDWNVIEGRRIRSVRVDVVTLGISNRPPLVVLSGYEQYMYQKYGMYSIGMGDGKQSVVPFAGLQVGGYKNGRWVIIDVNLLERTIKVNLQEGITSTAVKNGVV